MFRKCDNGIAICTYSEVQDGIEYCLRDGIFNAKIVVGKCDRFENNWEE
jgi:hypothetical protein